MMKFHQLTCLGLGLVSVPIIAGGQDEPRDLRAALGSTLTLIDDLTAIEDGLATRNPEALDALLRVAPSGGATQGPEHDERVLALRAEVNGLRTHLDELERVAIENLVDDPALTAFTPEQRGQLALGGPDAPAPRKEFEEQGFSLDELRQGKLMVRARRFEEAEKILVRFTKSNEARYWLGRALAGQGRAADALDVYTTLAAEEDSGQFGQWAAQDASMLELERELVQRSGGSQ